MWKATIRTFEPKELGQFAPAMSFFPADFEKIVRTTCEIFAYRLQVAIVKLDVLGFVFVRPAVPIDVFPDVRFAVHGVPAVAVKPNVRAGTSGKNEFCMRKFLIDFPEN